MLLIIDSTIFSFLFPALVILSVVGGYFAARRFYTNKNITWKASGIENGIIGLFALLLSLTLLMSGNIQKERTVIVHQLADGIAQMKRTADLLPRPLQDSVNVYLSRHLDVHIAFFEEKINKPEILINNLNKIHGQFWKNVSRMEDSSKQDVIPLPVYNQLNSVSYKLAYSYNERVPGLILFLIIISSCLIGVFGGLHEWFRRKNTLPRACNLYHHCKHHAPIHSRSRQSLRRDHTA